MTDEEKKAITRLIFHKEYAGLSNGKSCIVNVEDIETVVNLVLKLQKEMELAKKSLIENANIADERNQLLVENQKKDKIIREMVEKIEEFRANDFWDAKEN